MRYCRKCILPDTRPGLEIGPDGTCSACLVRGSTRPEVDWEARKARFSSIVKEVSRLKRPYDCVVPVSGGKDSTWQVLTCLEHGLRVLAVTWKTPGRTDLGARNLQNLIELGVDHIDFTINPRVERRFLYESLVRYGTTAIPMHLAIFNLPTQVAVRWGAPLVIWGENSAREYVGDETDADSFELDAEWVRKYGAVHGTTAADWISEELTERDLTPYVAPTPEEIQRAGVRALFLGMFFPWDSAHTFAVAHEHGFQPREQGPKTGFYAYADIDDEFISIHHYLKWYKFGFTRAWDNLSLEIRNARITRDQAIEALRGLGDQTPHSDIRAFCDYVGLSDEHFYELIEKFRDPKVWSRANGVWRIDDFLIPDWQWT